MAAAFSFASGATSDPDGDPASVTVCLAVFSCISANSPVRFASAGTHSAIGSGSAGVVVAGLGTRLFAGAATNRSALRNALPFTHSFGDFTLSGISWLNSSAFSPGLQEMTACTPAGGADSALYSSSDIGSDPGRTRPRSGLYRHTSQRTIFCVARHRFISS